MRQYPHGLRSRLAQELEPQPEEGHEFVWVGSVLKHIGATRFIISYDARPDMPAKRRVNLAMWLMEAPWCRPEDMLDESFPQWRVWKGIFIPVTLADAYIEGIDKLSMCIKDGSIDSLKGVPIHNVARRHRGLKPTCNDSFEMRWEPGRNRRVGITRRYLIPSKNTYRHRFSFSVSCAQWLVLAPKLKRKLEEMKEEK